VPINVFRNSIDPKDKQLTLDHGALLYGIMELELPTDKFIDGLMDGRTDGWMD